jgi:capsular exopolysaccharide synthesis family protein
LASAAPAAETAVHSGAEQTDNATPLLTSILERCKPATWNPDQKTMLFSDGQHPALGAEEFRTLRSHLYMIRDRQPLHKLLITSALPKEGKTFVAGNLAQVIVRQPGRRVLLVDADLRLSELHQRLGASLKPGLSEYLRGEADEFSIIQRGPIESLFFIAGGKHAPNPSELIGNTRFKLLLQRLAPAFDWVILDSPPVVPVSDAKLLADLCDGVLIVVQAGTTPYDLARKVCQELREKRLLGVVLNCAEASSGYSSYYYYGGRAEKK